MLNRAGTHQPLLPHPLRESMGGTGVPEPGNPLSGNVFCHFRPSGISRLRYQFRRLANSKTDNGLRRFRRFGASAGTGASAGGCRRPETLSQEVTP